MCRMLITRKNNILQRSIYYYCNNQDAIGICEYEKKRINKLLRPSWADAYSFVGGAVVPAMIHYRFSTGGQGAHPFTTKDNRYIYMHNGYFSSAVQKFFEKRFKKKYEIDSEIIGSILQRYNIINALSILYHLNNIIGNKCYSFIYDTKRSLFFCIGSFSYIPGVAIASDDSIFSNNENTKVIETKKEDILILNQKLKIKYILNLKNSKKKIVRQLKAFIKTEKEKKEKEKNIYYNYYYNSYNNEKSKWYSSIEEYNRSIA